MRNTHTSLAAKAPLKKAPGKSKSGKGKQCTVSPAGSDAPAQPTAKKYKTTTEADSVPEPPDLASCTQALVELAPQMVCLLSVLGLVPYES